MKVLNTQMCWHVNWTQRCWLSNEQQFENRWPNLTVVWSEVNLAMLHSIALQLIEMCYRCQMLECIT